MAESLTMGTTNFTLISNPGNEPYFPENTLKIKAVNQSLEELQALLPEEEDLSIYLRDAFVTDAETGAVSTLVDEVSQSVLVPTSAFVENLVQLATATNIDLNVIAGEIVGRYISQPGVLEALGLTDLTVLNRIVTTPLFTFYKHADKVTVLLNQWKKDGDYFVKEVVPDFTITHSLISTAHPNNSFFPKDVKKNQGKGPYLFLGAMIAIGGGALILLANRAKAKAESPVIPVNEVLPAVTVPAPTEYDATPFTSEATAETSNPGISILPTATEVETPVRKYVDPAGLVYERPAMASIFESFSTNQPETSVALETELSSEGRAEITDVMTNIQLAISNAVPLNPGTTTFHVDETTGMNRELYKAIEDMLYYISIGRGDELTYDFSIPPIQLYFGSGSGKKMPALNLSPDDLIKFERTKTLIAFGSSEDNSLLSSRETIAPLDPFLQNFGFQLVNAEGEQTIWRNNFKNDPLSMHFVIGADLETIQKLTQEGAELTVARYGVSALNLNVPETLSTLNIVFNTDTDKNISAAVNQTKFGNINPFAGEESVYITGAVASAD